MTDPTTQAPPGGATDAERGDPRPRLVPLVNLIAAVVSLAHIYFNTLATLPENWVSALHFGGLGLLCALIFPLARTRGVAAGRAVLAIDALLGLLALACAVYLIYAETPLYRRGVRFIWSDWAFAVLAVALAIEFTRRTTGWIIPILIVLSLTYVGFWGRYVGGVFQFPGLSWETVLYRSYFGGDGMFGLIARISSSYVFMFILFGAFLVRSGAGEFIVDLARSVAGRFTGGPGFVAVLGSGMMGSISGSAVANTVTTGVITIPLMRRAGFPPRFAAGVEAAASTGGQLMPPIMGAGAFVMASYTRIPYLTIIAVSFLPAVMYFLSVAFWVRIEAKKRNVVPVLGDAPGFLDIMRRGGHSLIPIAVLVALLVVGYTPTYAAGISILAVIVASWVSREHRMGPWAVWDALVLGARNMVTTGLLLVAVGLIVNVIATTGTGNTFSLMITDWAGGSLLITIVLVALASLVLGMGLPVTASYIVLGTLSAPALYELIAHGQVVQALAAGAVPDAAKAVFLLVAPEAAATLGQPMPTAEAAALVAQVPAEFSGQLFEQMLSPAALTTALLSAHMIIYWLSQDSNITPPVCLTAFAAAGIAGTKPMATGLTAWKIAKGLYIVPLLFAYTPFLAGNVPLALWIFAFGTVGIYALTAAIEGYMEAPLSWPERALAAAIGAALLWPTGPTVNVPGFAAFVLFFAFNLWKMRRAARRRAGVAAAG